MALSRSGLAFVAVACLATGLGGCASTNGSSGPVVTEFDNASTAARLRNSGARETTLRAFCNHPPHAATPAGAAAIRASCSPRVLGTAGDAAVFEKGGGLYHVVFKHPVKNGDICNKDSPPQSICGNFSYGDTMHTSRIDAS